MLVGYARVSSADQTLGLQKDALAQAGCERVFTDTANGGYRHRTARRPSNVDLESIHAVTYFVPHVPAAFEQLGLGGFWRSYFAGRAAPLGPVGAASVIALFFNFAPPMVARALADV